MDQLVQDLTGRPHVILIGAQTIPNLLPAIQLRPRHAVMVSTRDLEAGNSVAHPADCLRNCLRELGITSERIDVDSGFDVAGVRNVVRDVLGRHPDAIVNITGGTKLMMLGAGQAAGDVEAPMLYLDTLHRVIHVFVGQRRTQFPLTAYANLRLTLAAHGWEVRDYRQYSEDDAEEARWLLENLPAWWHIRRQMASDIASQTLPIRSKTERRFLNRLLERRAVRVRYDEGYATVTFVDQRRAKFYAGDGWIAAFVAGELHKAGAEELVTDLKVAPSTAGSTPAPEEEVDVAAIRGGRSAFISCKSSAGQLEHQQLHEWADKASKYGGSFARSAVVGMFAHKESAPGRPHPAEGETADKYHAYAQAARSNLFLYEDLRNKPEALAKLLG